MSVTTASIPRRSMIFIALGVSRSLTWRPGLGTQ